VSERPLISQPRSFRQRALLIVLAALLVVFVLWNVPQLTFLLYPLRLFVTFIHEFGHGLMALLTGGHVVGVVVNPDTSGVTTTLGGDRALILPAGYLGAAFFGAALFYVVNTYPYSRTFSVILGVALVGLSAAFTGFLSQAFIIGVLSGVGLVLLGWKVNAGVNLLVLDVLAIVCGLNAVLDLLALIRYSGASLAGTLNDAGAFSREVAPILPGATWAFLWALIAVGMQGVSVWYSVVRPLRKA
jgi:hypothetical protein